MTYDDALTYLDSLKNFERQHDAQAMQAVRLERMRLLCERLGNPQQLFRSILVGGTNGKGSICAMLYAILRAAGFRVGLYTSPHLYDVRERIRISGSVSAGDGGEPDWISREELARQAERLREAIQDGEGAWPEGPPTYFEAMTAIALLHFARRRAQWAILEVGLGGRLDATNVVDPAVSVLGPVGFDHTDVLGETLLSIASEKAGIFRPGRAVISAAQEGAVSALFRRLTNERVVEYGRGFHAEILSHNADGLEVNIRGLRGRYDRVRLPLIGRHQAQNAAVSIAVIETIAGDGIPHEPVRAGFASVRWPGRVEVIRRQPWIVLDGAHNPQAAQTLRAAVEDIWPGVRTHLLVGMSHDKPIRAVGDILAPLAASVICTRSRHQRACDAQRLAAEFAPSHRSVAVIPDSDDAMTYALNTVPPDGLILVTGSLFLVGEMRIALEQARHQLI